MFDVVQEQMGAVLAAELLGLRVLGIDPGLTRMGWGIVEERSGALVVLGCGTLGSPPGDHSRRLRTLFEGLSHLMTEWKPQAVAVEKVFLKANLNTGVSSIQAAGIAILAAAIVEAPVHEYSPPQVKLSVVGNGSATKDQIKYMVGKLLGPRAAPDTADAADALAVAITHLSAQAVPMAGAVK